MRERILLRLALLAALAVVSGAAICARAQKKATTRPVEASGTQEVGQPAKSGGDVETREATDGTSYSYEFTNPSFHVSRIKLVHDEAGRGTVAFERKTSDEKLVEPLQLSPEVLKRINQLWDTLRFLDAGASYQSERQYPHLGTMRLTVARGGRERTAEFNWTENLDARALANEYRRAADQVMFVFEINVARENQPLEAPKLLEYLDRLIARGGISDARQLIPLLKDLSTDERLPLIARNRAGKILRKVEKQVAK